MDGPQIVDASGRGGAVGEHFRRFSLIIRIQRDVFQGNGHESHPPRRSFVEAPARPRELPGRAD